MAERKTAREIFSEVCRNADSKDTATGWRIAKLRDNDGKKFWAGIFRGTNDYGVLIEDTEQELRALVKKVETEWDSQCRAYTWVAQKKFRKNLKSIRALVRLAVHQAGVTKGKRALVADVMCTIQGEITDEKTFTDINKKAFLDAVEMWGTVLD